MLARRLLPSLIVLPVIFIALYYYGFRESTVFYQVLGLENKYVHLVRNDYVNALPSLVHVYSSYLLSWWANRQKNGLFYILLWSTINILFEFGQRLTELQVHQLPDILANYFSHGRFSWFDIAGVAVGACAAYLTILTMNEAQHK